MLEHEPSPAREYHEVTKHHRGEASERRLIDVNLIPRPYKRYRDMPSVRLPAPAAPAGGGTLSLEWLATLLRYSAGILRRHDLRGRTVEFRAASCTGALYHVELYLVCGGLDGLRPGVYHYDVQDEALDALRSGDYRAVVSENGGVAESDAEAFVILTSTFWRNAWRYQERAYRHVFWDSGTIIANLLSLASAERLQPRLYAGFVDAELNRLIGVDSRREAATCVVALGRGASHALAPEVEAIVEQTEPLSGAEIEYPLIWQTHAATSLTDADAVLHWRDAAPAETARTVRIPGSGPLQRVIERRGSARRFSPTPLSRAELAALLQSATQPLPADFPSLTRAYVIANNVEGLEAGLYAYEAEHDRLVRLQAAELRDEAGRLALDQPAAARAAVNLYFVTRFEDLLSSLSDRGYRAAQLEAGVRGGLVYLTATALGLRATGLTFYDDEVAQLLGEPEDTAVLFLAAAGR